MLVLELSGHTLSRLTRKHVSPRIFRVVWPLCSFWFNIHITRKY